MTDRKKVAMILTGHLRTYKDNFDNLKSCILDHYDVDTYVSTWDMNAIKSKRLSKLSKMTEDEINTRVGIYPNLKKVCISTTSEVYEIAKKDYGLAKQEGRSGKWDMNNKKYPLFPYNTTFDEIIKISSAWYCVQEGFKLIDNPERYDVLMRNRFDMLYFKPIEFKDHDLVVTPPSPKKKEAYKIRNYIQYGKPIIKNLMSNMYDHVIRTLCRYRNFSSEHMLEYVLDNNFPTYYVDHGYIDLKHYRVNP
jgi:hypothetical protein